MSEPRAYTTEEARDLYLQHIANIATYWARQEDQTPLQRCNGVAFSILALFDGDTMLPGCDIKLSPHPEDQEFRRDEGSNWFEPGQTINDYPMHEFWRHFEIKADA